MTQFFIPNYRSVSLQLCCFILAQETTPSQPRTCGNARTSPRPGKKHCKQTLHCKNIITMQERQLVECFLRSVKNTNHTITVGHTKLVLSKIPLLTHFLKQTRERTLLANNSVVNCPCAVKTCPVSSKMLT